MLTPPVAYQVNEEWLDLRQVQNYAQLLGKTLYHQGDLSYFEAVNKESLSKGYSRVEEEGVLVVVKSKDSKIAPRVRLSPSWAPSRDSRGKLVVEGSKLWELCERISLSRREGKNRRDGTTVESRVLGLVELVGDQLWSKARLPASGSVQVVEVEEKPRTSRRKLQTRAKI